MAEYLRKYADDDAYGIACLQAQRGNADDAFEWLERSLENREWQLTFLATEPALDPLRGDPRFEVLLERVGLPPAARDSGMARAMEHDFGTGNR